ncbi:hypothetical protein HZB00_00160 [Candidatus Woesearchaeota archaeon]|nr:hypothetical protein [Candidatus Woesearchaeota archaeon]
MNKRTIFEAGLIAVAFGLSAIEPRPPKAELPSQVVEFGEKKEFYYSGKKIAVYKSREAYELRSSIVVEELGSEIEKETKGKWTKLIYNGIDKKFYLVAADSPKDEKEEKEIKYQAMHIEDIVQEL